METEPRREVIERWLEEPERAAIREWCKGSLIPLDEWPKQADLAGFCDLAVRRLMDLMIRKGEARSQTRALEIAAPKMGLHADAVRKRWQRRRRSVLRTDCPAPTDHEAVDFKP